MAEVVGKRFYGNPDSVRQLGEAHQRTATELARLRARLEQTVSETVLAERWCGPASQTFLGRVQDLLNLLTRTTSDCERMKDTLHTSAGMLAEAKAHFEFAEVQATSAQASIGDDLVVKPWPGVQNPNQARIAWVQGLVYQAREMAEQAHRMIERMDSTLARALAEQAEQMAMQAVNLAPVVKGAGTMLGAARRGGRLLKGRSGSLEEIAAAARDAPRNRIGSVDPPQLGADGKPTTVGGNITHDQIWELLKRRYPNLQFGDTPPSQLRGPDMRVQGRTPGTPDPGFDWLEIKPDAGTDQFAYTQWGKPGWQGRGRLVTYDNLGNVYELDLPYPF